MMSKIVTTIYMHRSSEENRMLMDKVCPDGDWSNFKWICSEVELKIEIDTESGAVRILEVDEDKVMPKEEAESNE